MSTTPEAYEKRLEEVAGELESGIRSRKTWEQVMAPQPAPERLVPEHFRFDQQAIAAMVEVWFTVLPRAAEWARRVVGRDS